MNRLDIRLSLPGGIIEVEAAFKIDLSSYLLSYFSSH